MPLNGVRRFVPDRFVYCPVSRRGHSTFGQAHLAAHPAMLDPTRTVALDGEIASDIFDHDAAGSVLANACIAADIAHLDRARAVDIDDRIATHARDADFAGTVVGDMQC